MVEIGDTAPGFTLQGWDGEEIRTFSLSDALETRPAVLAFYIYDYSPVCTDQMCEINDMEFLTFNDEAAVLGISTDGPYSHRQFATDEDISYPLLTDDDKDVYADYGMVRETEDGTRQLRRGIVVVDTDRTVQYTWVAEDNWETWEVTPLHEANETLRELT